MTVRWSYPRDVVLTGDSAVRQTCLCSHARISHTRGEGNCWQHPCGCRSYRPAPGPAAEALAGSIARHPAGKGLAK